MVRSTAKHLVTWRLGNFFFFLSLLGERAVQQPIFVLSLEDFAVASTCFCRGPFRHLSFRLSSLQHSLTAYTHWKSKSFIYDSTGYDTSAQGSLRGPNHSSGHALAGSIINHWATHRRSAVFCTDTVSSAHHDDNILDILLTDSVLLSLGRPHHNFYPSSIM